MLAWVFAADFFRLSWGSKLPKHTLGLRLQVQFLSRFWRSHFAQKNHNPIQADLRNLAKRSQSQHVSVMSDLGVQYFQWSYSSLKNVNISRRYTRCVMKWVTAKKKNTPGIENTSQRTDTVSDDGPVRSPLRKLDWPYTGSRRVRSQISVRWINVIFFTS